MNNRIWIALSMMFAVVAAVVALPQAAAANETAPAAIPRGCVVHGAVETCLSNPTAAADGRDRLIEERLVALAASAQPGDSIRVAMYTWTRPAFAQALVAAKDRGVDVAVVLDGVNEADQTDGYTTLADGGVALTSCDASCLGTNLNHSKYFLFDIGGVQSVAVTSSNLTTTQTELFNNLLKVDGDAKLYDFYLGFWQRMNAQSWTVDGDAWTDDDKTILGDSGAGGYVYPRRGDNLLWLLDSVTECSADGDGDGDPDDRIWVAASLFTEARTGVRDKLVELQDELGCDVRVIVENTGTESWVESGGLDAAKVATVAKSHNKLILVDARYLGDWDEVAVSGSHNLTGTSLTTNDEIMTRVSDVDVAKLYFDYHAGMFGTAA